MSWRRRFPGSNVVPGNNPRITWDVGAGWNQQVSTQTKFRITVSDVPPGFSPIPPGGFTMGDALDGGGDAHTVNVSAFQMAQNLVTHSDEGDLILKDFIFEARVVQGI